MTEEVSRIQILGPEYLQAIIQSEVQAGRAVHFSNGLLRLLDLHSRYISNTAGPNTPERLFRVGTIMPIARSLTSIEWTIFQDPERNGFRGRHVLTGGLVLDPHSGLWGLHT